MARPDERKFVTFAQGKIRDEIILAKFRLSLRSKTNPDTGQLFTEDEIAIITQRDSRFFIEADAIDMFGQAVQQRAIWLADQVRPERAASSFLHEYHGPLWIPEGLLPAVGGSGVVTASGSPGTIYSGSTVLGDPIATVARDPAGKRYQVLVSAALPTGSGPLQMQAIDPGDDSNPIAGTVLTWINPPLGSNPQAIVFSTFTGGFNRETDKEFARRIAQRIRNKPGAGNRAQIRAWAARATTAVEDAFVYPCAFYGGSTMVAIAQKRGTTVGPLARAASIGTQIAVRNYLVPPVSSVMPHDEHMLVVPMVAEASDLCLKLAMPRGSTGGWVDADPWPTFTVGYPSGVRITGINVGGNPLVFAVSTDSPLAGVPLSGADVPALMIWNQATSRFELLDVGTVAAGPPNTYHITLNNAPDLTLAIGQLLSPANNRLAAIAEGIEDYFDELGPSEIVVSTDVRYVDAARYPSPDQEYPVRAGQGIIARLDDQLGGAMTAAELSYISLGTPSIPAAEDMHLGPSYLVVWHVGIYPF